MLSQSCFSRYEAALVFRQREAASQRKAAIRRFMQKQIVF